MSMGLPAPSMMVVFSLVTTTRSAVPRSARLEVLELDAEVFHHGAFAPVRVAMSTEHLLAAVAEARRLHRADLHGLAEVVHHEGGERVALDVLGDDQQRPAGLRDLLEHREELLHVADLLLVDEDVRLLEHRLHPVASR
jgi:hypothetical protein